MPTPAVRTARRLAACLDAADFAGAQGLLRPDCIYHFRGTTISPAATIIASYERAHADALATFDSIAYDSDIRPDADDPNAAVIHYTDILTHRGVTHRHHCAQRITIDVANDGEPRITRIEHIDLPGEHGALNAFLAKVGLPTRPPIRPALNT